MPEKPDVYKRQKYKNYAMLIALLCLVVVFFVVTMIKVKG